MIGTVGLIVFVLVQAANVVGLGLDAALLFAGMPTVTHRVWAGGIEGWSIGLGLLALQAVGAGGLAAHFYWR